MKIFLTLALAVACVALAATLVFYFGMAEENRELTVKLVQTENSLNLTQAELSDTENELEDTEKTLSELQEELTETESTLANTRQELVSSAENYRSVSASLAQSEENAASLQESLSDTNARLALAERTLYGLGITVAHSSENWDAELVDNDDAYDHTLAELKAFLLEDHTEHQQYVLNVYDCSEFSRDLHNRAEAAGIRAGVVHIWWENDHIGHALNLFLTTDYGLIYVDSTQPPDSAARVVKGKTYRGLNIRQVPPQKLRDNAYWDNLLYYNYVPTSNGAQAVTAGIEIYW